MKVDLSTLSGGIGLARPTFSMLLLLAMGDNPEKKMQAYDSLMAIASYLDTGTPEECPHGFWSTNNSTEVQQ